MHSEEHPRAIKFSHHPVEGVVIKGSFLFFTHDGGEHEKATHDAIHNPAKPCIVKKRRPNGEQDALSEFRAGV